MKGKEVYLRYLVPEDFYEFSEMARRSVRFHRGLLKLAKTKEEFDNFLTKIGSDSNECFLICRADDKAIVGIINLSQIFRGPLQSAYMGYALGHGFTGNGYATEAVRLIVTFAFRELKLHRLEANIQPHNTPSLNLVKRLGFTKEGFSERYLKIGGRWRDHERWAIIRDNWKFNA